MLGSGLFGGSPLLIQPEDKLYFRKSHQEDDKHYKELRAGAEVGQLTSIGDCTGDRWDDPHIKEP